jgi:hypothetical protein
MLHPARNGKDEKGSHRWVVSLHNHFSEHGAGFTQGLCERACVHTLCAKGSRDIVSMFLQKMAEVDAKFHVHSFMHSTHT